MRFRHVSRSRIGADEQEIGDIERLDGRLVEIQRHVDVAIVNRRQQDELVDIADTCQRLFVGLEYLQVIPVEKSYNTCLDVFSNVCVC